MQGVSLNTDLLTREPYKGMGPMEIAERGVSIANMREEQQARQDKAAEDQQMRQIMAQNPNNPQATQQQMTQQGFGPEAIEYQKQQAEMEYKQAATQHYQSQHKLGLLELEQKKATEGAAMLNTWYERNKNDFTSPRAAWEYEQIVPHIRSVGIESNDLPDKYNLSVPVLADVARKHGYNFAAQSKDEAAALRLQMTMTKEERDAANQAFERGVKGEELDIKKKEAAAKEEERQTAKSAAASEKMAIVELVDSIASDPNFSAGLNIKRIGQNVPGTPGYVFKKKIDNLRAKLSLDARAKLRGQGQISDKESQMLSDAVSMLDTGLSEEALRKELERIKGVMKKGATTQATQPETDQDPMGLFK